MVFLTTLSLHAHSSSAALFPSFPPFPPFPSPSHLTTHACSLLPLFQVQHECIPQAILGMDVLCQAKSGMGKTAVFVLSSLHQLEAKEDSVGALVLCHTRELAYQICNEFERFSRYLPDIKTKVFYGGVPVTEHKRILKSECPHIIVGTPGRILQLVREKELLTKGIKHFILVRFS